MWNQTPEISWECKYCNKTFTGRYTARKTVCITCKVKQRAIREKEKRKCINQDRTNKQQ